jgi:nucleoside-diphosphate-sugar epimerase
MVYGEPAILPVGEDAPVNSLEPYAASKIASEIICRSYEFMRKIPVTIVRNFNTYGPGQSISSLIPSIINEGLYKSKIEVWSSETLRDFLYVEDCVNALVEIIKCEKTKGETYNLGTGIGTTTGELVKLIAKELNVPWIDLKKPLPIGARFICDNSRIIEQTNWKPLIPLIDGIRITIQHYLRKRL